MKKIIAAFDGLKFSESTMQYAIHLTRQENAYLVGVFLDDLTVHSYTFADVAAYVGESFDERIGSLDSKDKETRDRSVDVFRESCDEAGIKYSIHRDRSIALQGLLKETIYSDLLIINNQETFTPFHEKVPAMFMKDLLTDVQCPVLIVPEEYKIIEKVVFLYDGEPSSVFAVKMFSYLMPSVKSERVEVLTVNSEKETLFVPGRSLIKEFMTRHYPKAEFVVCKGDAEEEIISYLKQQQESLLVILGAYRRGRVSRWFKPSMADSLMASLNVPLFIAHSK